MAANGLNPPRDPEKFMAWVVEMLGSLNRRLPGGSFTQPPAYVPSMATTDSPGLVELATVGETGTGADSTRAATPEGVRAAALSAAATAMATRAPAVHGHTMSDITDAATAIPEAVPVSTTATLGKVELATAAEAQAGTDAVRAVTPAGLKAFYDARLPIRRGTAAERDAHWGAPTATADQVTLARLWPTWFNTERGWLEQYFVGAAASGWTATDGPGLASGVPTGWYPIGGRMPRATLFAAGSQVLSGGTGADNAFTNWRAWGAGSRRSHADLFSTSIPNGGGANAALAVALPGVYTVSLSMALPAGSGIPVGVLALLSRGAARSIPQPVALYDSSAQTLQLRHDAIAMSAADYALFRLAVGSALTVGDGDATWLTVEYRSPQFEAA